MSTRRIEGLRARAERGSTEGERRAARIALGIHEAKAAEQKPEAVVVGSGMSDALLLAVWLAGLHEAEVFAGRLGRLVVWCPSQADAEALAGHANALVRVPDDSIQKARSSSGTVEDPETGRWGVLYSRRDLRPAV